jgi:hypothetical protein
MTASACRTSAQKHGNKCVNSWTVPIIKRNISLWMFMSMWSYSCMFHVTIDKPHSLCPLLLHCNFNSALSALHVLQHCNTLVNISIALTLMSVQQHIPHLPYESLHIQLWTNTTKGISFHPFAPRDNFSRHTVWCWENRISPKFVSQEHEKKWVASQVMGSFAVYNGHLILTPKG